MTTKPHADQVVEYLDRALASAQRQQQTEQDAASGQIGLDFALTVPVVIVYYLQRLWWAIAGAAVVVAAIVVLFFLISPARWIVLAVAASLVVMVGIALAIHARRAAALDSEPATVPQTGLVALDEQIAHLRQMREWLKDENLRRLVDEAIGEQVKASERRQRFFSIIWSGVGIVLGWVLSLVGSPAALLGLFK